MSTCLSLCVYSYTRNTSPATDQCSRSGHLIDDRSKFFRRFALDYFYIEGYQGEYIGCPSYMHPLSLIPLTPLDLWLS